MPALQLDINAELILHVCVASSADVVQSGEVPSREHLLVRRSTLIRVRVDVTNYTKDTKATIRCNDRLLVFRYSVAWLVRHFILRWLFLDWLSLETPGHKYA